MHTSTVQPTHLGFQNVLPEALDSVPNASALKDGLGHQKSWGEPWRANSNGHIARNSVSIKVPIWRICSHSLVIHSVTHFTPLNSVVAYVAVAVKISLNITILDRWLG
jgi:hypothetical protein